MRVGCLAFRGFYETESVLDGDGELESERVIDGLMVCLLDLLSRERDERKRGKSTCKIKVKKVLFVLDRVVC